MCNYWKLIVNEITYNIGRDVIITPPRKTDIDNPDTVVIPAQPLTHRPLWHQQHAHYYVMYRITSREL